MGWGEGDFTRDGNVDVSDLGILATNYGTRPAPECRSGGIDAMLLAGMTLCLAPPCLSWKRSARV